MTGEVMTIDPPTTAVAQTNDSRALMNIIERAALNPEFNIEKLQQLFALKEKWDESNARKLFTAAMAAFKANPPEILKDKQVSYTLKTGGKTEYMHATLGEICRAVIKGLSDHGFSHRWDVKQVENKVNVTCIITHEAGHSESVTLFAMPDDSGGKNSIQALGSTVTYLQRYTLLSGTGLAAAEDDDGVRGEEVEKITDKEALDLQAMAEAVGADKAKFLAYLGVERLADLPKKELSDAIKKLEEKGKR